jgi:hypothetical protein
VARMTGAELIAAERRRQVDAEGWTPGHDDEHSQGELRRAAACYLSTRADGMHSLGRFWPWEQSWWKPSPDPIRNLAKAGALIAAEIDRLQRAASTPGEEPSSDD